MPKYVIVTPARNEEFMLPDLAQDIINQSIKPLFWVIVDDQSIDDTWQIIKDYEKHFLWIRGIQIKANRENEYAHERYAEVVRKGIKHALFLRDEKYLSIYLAIVDADIRLESRYFEKLFTAFRKDPRLGVASGVLYEKAVSKKQIDSADPRGALLFRAECYKTIGGFLGHEISLRKARRKKWNVQTFLSIKAIHQRNSGSQQNYWFSLGKYSYFIDYHPMSVILSGFHFILKGFFKKGVTYIAGYLQSIILSEEKIKSDDVREYYRNSFNRLLNCIRKSYHAECGK